MSSAATSVSSATSVSTERFTGRVKWFNNKAGYGFITVTDGPKTGTDIFVHHSSIRVDAQQYKYLVQGEYTEFALTTIANSAHECQASDVSGIKGGKLMCETRMEARSTRTNYKGSEQTATTATATATDPLADDWKPVKKPRQLAAPSDKQVAPRSNPSTVSRGTSTAGRGASSAGRGASSAGRGRGAKRT